MEDLSVASLAIMAMVFIAVVLAVLALAPMFSKPVDLKARLATTAPSNGAIAAGSVLRSDPMGSLWARLVMEVERRGVSLTDTKAEMMSEQLMLAGYDQPWAVRVYVLSRTVLTLTVPAVTVIVLLLAGSLPSAGKLYMLIVMMALVGLYLPNFVVSRRAGQRRTEILNGFPDTLDLMLVCVEAGLGLDACFNRVGAEIVTSHRLLAELFASVSLELRAGRTREMALRMLARRTAIPEIGAFVTLIIQSDKLGASISTALKIYAAEMREGRKMRAEEKAHRLPVILSVPLVLFLLPTMVSVLMLPAVISMRHNLSGVFGAQAK